MKEIFNLGITAAIELDEIEKVDSIDRRKIIEKCGKEICPNMTFESMYKGMADNTYRFQVQEYKNITKEKHQFRYSNLVVGDIIVVIVGCQESDTTFNYTVVPVDLNNIEKINGKTITYKQFIEMSDKGEEFFDIQ